ncbi:hypothetical protein H0B56_17045 [Haloechinothrix sp. YIM 98757]|uniref:Uncharacterized protein n=1 Tax=Haloechinothrix aidingensis TaxID=2752311 RepID=A0A838AD95_9PSEU|nr:hypothetical protein [Haloechinothrix aidingensis]MBA0127259.1 hypothetical protein [Haloechinothrix aidingensis]
MLAEDREFLARIARAHRTVTESFFALTEGALSREATAWLGGEYTAIGAEFTRRAQRSVVDPEPPVVDDDGIEYIPGPDSGDEDGRS